MGSVCLLHYWIYFKYRHTLHLYNLLFCERGRICDFIYQDVFESLKWAWLSVYMLHTFLTRMHFAFLRLPGSSCQKQHLNLLQFRQRPQLQLSNAKHQDRGARNVTALFWVIFSKRGLKHLPLRKPSTTVLLLSVFSGGKCRLHAPTMQMMVTYIQKLLNFEWLWKRSRWMRRRRPSRVWCRSNRRTQTHTVSAPELRWRIAHHHRKT